ncbi:signal peptidase II [Staphylococcus aureus]
MGNISGKMTFFFIITIIILIALVYSFIKDAQYNLFMQVAISLLTGALGRLLIEFEQEKLLTLLIQIFLVMIFPIFNIADSSLTIGVILIIIALLKDTSNKKGEEGS